MNATSTLDIAEYEALAPHRVVERDGARAVFATPNRQTLWRADTLFTKEPDTIEWIAGFDAADVLVDVGANVGMYAIWAAKTRGVRVFAFEPESQNYALLNRNIQANGLDGLVRAYCIALSDSAGLGPLHLSDLGAGGSCHSFGESLDHHNRPRASAFTQGSVSATLDGLVASGAIPVPTHVKVDVDGIEPKVIAGGRSTLADRRVRSVLIEINSTLDEHWEIVDLMLALGFDYSQGQVDRAQRTAGAFQGVGNYVFRR
jgi:FkbM family methyltransferase